MRLFNQMETHLTAAVSCRSTCNLTVLQLHSFFFFFNLSSVYQNNYCPLDLWQCDYWTEILIFPHPDLARHLRECFIAGEQPPERTCTHGNLGCSLNNRYEVCDLHVNGKDESLQLINVITIPQEECTCLEFLTLWETVPFSLWWRDKKIYINKRPSTLVALCDFYQRNPYRWQKSLVFSTFFGTQLWKM